MGGKTLFTWCAADALVAPLVLNRLGEIESRSPLRKEVVRLRVSPEGIESIDPKDAVLSMIVVDIDKAHLNSVLTLWGTFCDNIFLFASRDEAAEWARGKENIELLSLEDAYQFAKLMAGFVPIDAQATWRFARPESARVRRRALGRAATALSAAATHSGRAETGERTARAEAGPGAIRREG